MGRRLYVGNLPYTTGEAELQELFSKAGTVESVRVMRDAATGRARGFAFVEMATDEEAQKAATEFNQYQMGGRSLTVNEARPKPEGGFGGGGGHGAGPPPATRSTMATARSRASRSARSSYARSVVSSATRRRRPSTSKRVPRAVGRTQITRRSSGSRSRFSRPSRSIPASIRVT